MKKHTDVLKEYVRRLEDADLKFIQMRLTRRLGGDLGEAVELIQRHPEVDRWLATATGANDFFDMIDQIDSYVQAEVKKRKY